MRKGRKDALGSHRRKAANYAEQAPAGSKAKRPPGARASPLGTAAKTPAQSQKGMAHNWWKT